MNLLLQASFISCSTLPPGRTPAPAVPSVGPYLAGVQTSPSLPRSAALTSRSTATRRRHWTTKARSGVPAEPSWTRDAAVEQLSRSASAMDWATVSRGIDHGDRTDPLSRINRWNRRRPITVITALLLIIVEIIENEDQYVFYLSLYLCIYISIYTYLSIYLFIFYLLDATFQWSFKWHSWNCFKWRPSIVNSLCALLCFIGTP